MKNCSKNFVGIAYPFCDFKFYKPNRKATKYKEIVKKEKTTKMKINMFVIDNKPNEKMVKNAKIEEGMTILYPEICKKNEIEMKIKPKPYIIVKLNEDGTFRAIRITSQSRYGKNCIEIVKGSKEFDSMGLRENSVIMVNSINTIIPNYIIKDIGKCTPSLFLKLKSMLSDIFREELTYHSK